MDWRLAMARLQLQLDGLSQASWRYDTRPPAPAAASLVSTFNIVFGRLVVFGTCICTSAQVLVLVLAT